MYPDLLLSLSNTLEPLYNDQFPVNNKKLNIPFYLTLRTCLSTSVRARVRSCVCMCGLLSYSVMCARDT
jgi:hypothetical protein